MKLSKIKIRNFKAFDSSTDIEIKPITIFIGTNSSGKSSIIHAIASLAQTLKIQNNKIPLILDDDKAYVHLGRYIDVIHSKKYGDSISLGFSIDNVHYYDLDNNLKISKTKKGCLTVEFRFKCVKLTQEIYIDYAEYIIDDIKYTLKKDKKKNEYILTYDAIKKSINVSLSDGFIVNTQMPNFYVKNDIGSFWPFIACQEAIKDVFLKVFYLGPFRQPPQRSYQTRGSYPNEVGAFGENAITLLANDLIQSRARPHQTAIAKWLSILKIGKEINLKRLAKSDQFEASLKMCDDSELPIVDLGYGISQVLPVLTQCTFSPTNSYLLFEQPELHLHSLSARELIKVFIEISKLKSSTIIIETHSPDLVGQLQLEISSRKISVDDIAVYKVQRVNKSSIIKKLNIENDGEILESWKEGFCENHITQ